MRHGVNRFGLAIASRAATVGPRRRSHSIVSRISRTRAGSSTPDRTTTAETASPSGTGASPLRIASEPVSSASQRRPSAIETVIRKAARGKSTIAVPEGRADRTLLIVGGPPQWLNREAIADGRRWLAEETESDAILSGDAPVPDGEAVSAVVVRSGVDEPERIREIRETIE